jgi:hypothetical protein
LSFKDDLYKAIEEPCPVARKVKVGQCLNEWVETAIASQIISTEFIKYCSDPEGLIKHIKFNAIRCIAESLEKEIARSFKQSKFDNHYIYSITFIRKNKRE